jgi:hypothetical protein
MILPLRHPLTLGSTTLSQLTFRDHTTAADYLAFDRAGGVAQRIALIASLTGTDEALIQRLHGSDYLRAEREADRLLTADQAEEGEDPAGKSPVS